MGTGGAGTTLMSPIICQNAMLTWKPPAQTQKIPQEEHAPRKKINALAWSVWVLLISLKYAYVVRLN